MTHGEKRAKELVSTSLYEDRTIAAMYIEGTFLAAAAPSAIEERADILREVLAREIDAARKNTKPQRRKSK